MLAYADELLPSELLVLCTMVEPLETVHLEDIVQKLKIISQERVIINNVITIIKIVLTSGANSATPERSFPLARRVKTWLRSSMIQKRFNTLAILHSHKDVVDNLSLVAIGNEFVDNIPNR